ncbi:MAG: carboxypeptidase-like regulatory domain-containing protein, partial [Bacteroidia bacterium]|nr:carboxypeptidase-like regulatory domain-containing protein [Bacteroidia bacterium]
MSKIFVHFLIGFFIFLFSCSSLKAQEKYTISGYIKDAQNGEILLGSNVYVSEIQNGAVSNVYGFYSITLEAGEYNIRYSYTGYNSKSIKLILKNDTTVNLELGSSNVELNAINITGEKEHENVTSLQMGVEKIDIMTIKSIPQFLG